MKIIDYVYKTSGVEYETNSNTFLLEDENELILLDLGFDHKQWDCLKKTIQEWKLDNKKITKAFLTHGHYDHEGNTELANKEGIEVYCADPDAYKIENGYEEMEKLFNTPWRIGRVDYRLKDGEVFKFKNFNIEVYQASGHSLGSYAFVVDTGKHRALCTGDMFYVKPSPPKDDIELELAYMGGEDFDLKLFQNTLKKMSTLHCDVLLPGHYYVYYGDVDKLCEKANHMALEIKGE